MRVPVMALVLALAACGETTSLSSGDQKKMPIGAPSRAVEEEADEEDVDGVDARVDVEQSGSGSGSGEALARPAENPTPPSAPVETEIDEISTSSPVIVESLIEKAAKQTLAEWKEFSCASDASLADPAGLDFAAAVAGEDVTVSLTMPRRYIGGQPFGPRFAGAVNCDGYNPPTNSVDATVFIMLFGYSGGKWVRLPSGGPCGMTIIEAGGHTCERTTFRFPNAVRSLDRAHGFLLVGPVAELTGMAAFGKDGIVFAKADGLAFDSFGDSVPADAVGFLAK